MGIKKKAKRKAYKYVTKSGLDLVVKFGYPPGSNDLFYSTKEFVKSFQGSFFDMGSRSWWLPANSENVIKLKNYGFDILGSALDVLVKPKMEFKEQKTKPVDRSLLKGLRENQIECVEIIEARKGRAIIADPMGFGKTIEALGYLKCHPEIDPVLIVCPSMQKLVWRDEINTWRPGKVEIISGQIPYGLKRCNYYIINWDILQYWVEELSKIQFRIIIGDEIQFISNQDSKRSIAFTKLCKCVRKRLFLSGTPFRKRLRQFYLSLHLIAPRFFNDYDSYLTRYCGPSHDGWGWKYDGSSNVDELKKLIKPFVIRRPKKDLPKKTRSIISLDTKNNWKEYSEISNNIIELYNNYGYSNKLTEEKFDKLKNQVYLLKRDSVIQWLKELLMVESKHVSFVWHKWVMDDLMNEFKDIAVKIDGSLSAEAKYDAKERFQKDDRIKLVFGNIRSGGVGIDLTAANTLSFLEFIWSPDEHEQAEDRIHRFTQVRNVIIYYLKADGTIEEEIVKELMRGYKLIKNVLDNESVDFEGTQSFKQRVMDGYIKRMANNNEKK